MFQGVRDKWKHSCCAGFNQNGPHRLVCLNTWIPAGETVCESLGCVAFLEKMYLQGGLQDFKSFPPSPALLKSFSSFYLSVSFPPLLIFFLVYHFFLFFLFFQFFFLCSTFPLVLCIPSFIVPLPFHFFFFTFPFLSFVFFLTYHSFLMLCLSPFLSTIGDW